MTYEEIFAGRMMLMRVQRHIAQVGIMTQRQPDGALSIPWPDFQFRNRALEEAFFTVERLLCELEKEFESKSNAERNQRRRRNLRNRINKQVSEL